MTELFQLRRDSFGKLVFTGEDGVDVVGITPVRAFPIQAPTQDHTFAAERLSWMRVNDGLPAYPRTRAEGGV